MVPRLLYAAIAALLATVAFAADPVPPPKPTDTVTLKDAKPVTAAVGRKCLIEVETTAKKVTWKIPAEVDTVTLDGRRLAVWALPGTYTLTAMVPSGDDVLSVDVTLTVTGDVPAPVVPAINKAVRDAYAADTSANKAELAKKLAGLYRAAGTVTVKDTSIKTYFDLYSDVAAANAAQMGQTDLQGVRLAISKYLDAKLPTDKKTPIDRTLAAAEFLNVATALESLTK